MQRTLCLGNKRTLRETCIMSVFISSLSIKKLKLTNNTLYLENKKIKKFKKLELFIFFFFCIHLHSTEMPKFWENSGQSYDKIIL